MILDFNTQCVVEKQELIGVKTGKFGDGCD
jgi:hypothetical protein